MGYEVATVRSFVSHLKRLKKKYPSLEREVLRLGDQLAEDPFVGTALGNQCFKIRIAIASKGKGKSGGGRVITHVHVRGRRVFLLDIYDKSERSTITPTELDALLAEIQ